MIRVGVKDRAEILLDAIERELDQRRDDLTVGEIKALGAMRAKTNRFIRYLQADIATTQGEQRPDS